jgi:hypothetical protein
LPIHDNFASQNESTLGLTNAWAEPRWTRKQPQGQPAGPPLSNAVPDPAVFLADTPDVRVLYNPFYLPRTWIVHDIWMIPPVESLADPAAVFTMQALLFPIKTYLDPRGSAVIENDEVTQQLRPSQPNPSAHRSGESVRITHYDPVKVVLEGEMKEPGAVILGDTYYPDWNAEVAMGNGPLTTAAVMRANFGVRAVVLPTGRFKLIFHYHPFSFFYGLTISATAWLVLACGVLVTYLRRRWL